MSSHVADRLSAYLDGALPASDLELVQSHLETCGTCGRAYEELRTLRGFLHGLREPAMPPGLVERIHWRLARAEAETVRPSPWRSAWASVTRRVAPGPLRVALACVTLLVIVGLPMGRVAGIFTPHSTTFDPDAYVRDYLLLSSDRLTDDVTRTVLTHTALPESAPQR